MSCPVSRLSQGPFLAVGAIGAPEAGEEGVYPTASSLSVLLGKERWAPAAPGVPGK